MFSGYYNDHKSEFNLIEAQYHLAKIMVSGVSGPGAQPGKTAKAQNAVEAGQENPDDRQPPR